MPTLLYHHDIKDTEVWARLLQTDHYKKSGNLLMRRYYYAVFEGVFSHAESDHIQELLLNMHPSQGDLFTWIGECLATEEDYLILESAMNMLTSVLYYNCADVIHRLELESIPKNLVEITKMENEKVVQKATVILAGIAQAREHVV